MLAALSDLKTFGIEVSLKRDEGTDGNGKLGETHPSERERVSERNYKVGKGDQ